MGGQWYSGWYSEGSGRREVRANRGYRGIPAVSPPLSASSLESISCELLKTFLKIFLLRYLG